MRERGQESDLQQHPAGLAGRWKVRDSGLVTRRPCPCGRPELSTGLL